MKHLKKFNEVNSVNKISNDRVKEIILELNNISSKINDDINKSNVITKELNQYVTNKKSNNQIDDSYINFEALNGKLKESLSIISNIVSKLEDYNENGEQYLY